MGTTLHSYQYVIPARQKLPLSSFRDFFRPAGFVYAGADLRILRLQCMSDSITDPMAQIALMNQNARTLLDSASAWTDLVVEIGLTLGAHEAVQWHMNVLFPLGIDAWLNKPLFTTDLSTGYSASAFDSTGISSLNATANLQNTRFGKEGVLVGIDCQYVNLTVSITAFHELSLETATDFQNYFNLTLDEATYSCEAQHTADSIEEAYQYNISGMLEVS